MQLYKRIAFFLSLGIMGIGLISFSTTKQAEAQSNDDNNTNSVSYIPEDIRQSDDDNIAVANASTPTLTSTPTPTQAPTPTPIPPNDLEKDKFPEINALVEAYYNAKLACTIEGFADIVNDTSSINVDDLMLKTEYIKSYENITCYTKWVDTEIDYVVYVSYDMKFPTIDTLGPSLDELYIKTDEDGKPRIYLGLLSDITDSTLDEYRATDDVVKLITENKQKVDEAVESDESLKEFFMKLAQMETEQ